MITLPPFKAFLASNIPSVYDNTLSYYEELVKLIAYLEQQVVPAVNKNTADIQAYTDGLKELKEYVDNYFDNLDVQEEIDNKLDEMAEGGQLAGIIAQFLEAAPVFAYDTVASLISADNLIAGCIARTAGFHSVTDKGGAYYNIVAEATADDHKVFALDNGLYAVLIELPETTVNQYGAYGDGIHDDYVAIQYAIENNQFGTVKFADCTYAIGSTLKTYVDNLKKTSFILEPTTTIKALSNLTSLIELGGLGGNNEGVTNRYRAIVGGIFDATNCDAAIEINPLAMGLMFNRIEIINAGHYGIYIPKGAYQYSSDILIEESNISCTSSADDTTAIYCERPDNTFSSTKLNACKKGFYFEGGGQIITKCHGLMIGRYAESTFIHFHTGSLNFITDSYCDSFETFVQNDTSGDYTLTNSCYYSYVNDRNATLFKFATANPRCNISNNSFQMQAPETKHRGILFTGTFYSVMQAINQMIIENNQITRTSGFIEGDLLLKLNDYIPFWTDNADLDTTQWVKLGYLTAGPYYVDINIDVSGKKFNANFKLDRYSGTTYLTSYSSIKSDTNYSITLGVKYIGNTTGYPVYALYLKQYAGTAMKADITIHNNNTKTPFIPVNWFIRDVTKETETMDAQYNI